MPIGQDNILKLYTLQILGYIKLILNAYVLKIHSNRKNCENCNCDQDDGKIAIWYYSELKYLSLNQ